MGMGIFVIFKFNINVTKRKLTLTKIVEILFLGNIDNLRHFHAKCSFARTGH